MFRKLNNDLSCGRFKQFWNLVRKCKSITSISQIDISIEKLMKYFKAKFDINEYSGSVVINKADTFLQDKANALRGKPLTDISVDNVMITCSIAKMKIGCAPGLDGVMTEHHKYACNTNVVAVFRSIFNICLQFGIVPSNFRNGLLIKETTHSDTSVPNNYRPVTISPTLSKLMEIIILSHTQHQFSDAQFGFIEARGTEMAITLVNDVRKYCTQRGSRVYTYSLDAEGAFDAIPHSILFREASGVIPDQMWKILFDWYSNLKSVH